MTILIIGTLLGLIAGGVWSFAFGNPFSSGIEPGAIAGAIVGLFFLILGKVASPGAKLQVREVKFASTSMMLALFAISLILSIISGIAFWIID